MGNIPRVVYPLSITLDFILVYLLDLLIYAIALDFVFISVLLQCKCLVFLLTYIHGYASALSFLKADLLAPLVSKVSVEYSPSIFIRHKLAYSIHVGHSSLEYNNI